MDWKKLRPEDRVNVVVSMIDVVTQIAADSERQKNPRMSEEELISAVRRRFQFGRRVRQQG